MISAIVLAAGLSRRMGQPKMVLPWGEKTIIEQVIDVIAAGGVQDILVVTGGSREQVAALLESRKVELIYNPNFANGEMLESLQIGLLSLNRSSEAALMVLGDQPQIEVETVDLICRAYNGERHGLIIPSYRMRRGHPWLIGRKFWTEILALRPPQTLRDFLDRFASEINYIDINSSSILKDVDTPEDYRLERPGSSLT